MKLHLNILLVQLTPLIILIQIIEMVKIICQLDRVALLLQLPHQKLLRLRQITFVHIMAVFFLSSHDLGILDVTRHSLLAFPMICISHTTQIRIILVENLLINTFGTNPIRSRSLSKYCLRFRGEWRGAHDSMGAQGSGRPIVLYAILCGQKIVELKEFIGKPIICRLQNIHCGACNILLRGTRRIQRISQMRPTDLRQSLLLVIVPILLKLLILQIKLFRVWL